jgi:hypothetical protein
MRMRFLPIVVTAALAISWPFAEAGAKPPVDTLPSSPVAGTWGTDGTVYAVLLAAGRVYLGGSFSSVISPDGGATLPRRNLAVLDASTGAPLAVHPDPNGTVRAIATDGTRVFVGGSFTSIGGTGRSRIAALDPGSGAPLAGWSASADGVVQALVVAGGRLYLGGGFLKVNGTARGRLAAVEADGGGLLPWRADADDRVAAMTISQGAVVAGGWFGSVNRDGSQDGIVRLDASSGAVLPWGSHSSAEVLALVTGPDGSVYGGVGGPGGKIRAWSATGTARWSVSADGDVQAVAIASGRVIAGGHWLTIAGTSLARLVALDPSNGRLDTGWRPRPNRQVWALMGEGSRFVVGGAFTAIAGVSRRRVAVFA